MRTVTRLPDPLRRMFPIALIISAAMPKRAASHNFQAGQRVWGVDVDPQLNNISIVREKPRLGEIIQAEARLKIELLEPVDPDRHDLPELMDRIRVALSRSG